MQKPVLVIGGGISGIQASLDLADRGIQVYLVEKSPSIGGVMAQLDKTFPTMDCSMCILAPKMIECYRHPNIFLLTYSELKEVHGSVGDFNVSITKKPRYIDSKKCTGCDECPTVCPVKLPNEFERNLGSRKAIYRPFPQAVPNVFTIDKRGVPPCKAACPAGVNVQGYIALAREGKYNEAFELLLRSIPFPAVCGRVCFNPCEGECERGKVDKPLAIKNIKRFITDYETEQGLENVVPIPKTSEYKIAIVGAGPSGLTAAYELVKHGYHITVFEKMPEPGGMLRYGIPSYRLPKNILNIEIERIKKLGVEIVTDIIVGKDLTINKMLQKEYNAIYFAVGTQENSKLRIEGEDLNGVEQGLDFLKRINTRETVRLSGKVAVIGGGNVAIDTARSALRAGADEVYILYRRSRQEMPAYAEDVEAAEKEGVRLQFLINPIRFLGKKGRITAIECLRMQLSEPDESGRSRPIPINGSEFIVEVDNVLLAIGQTPETSLIPPEIEVARTNTVVVDGITLETNRKGVFAGGDIVRGPATVIEAIADGKRAAESIDRYLQGKDLKIGRNVAIRKVEEIPKEGVTITPRQIMPTLELNQRIGNFNEVELGFTEEMMKKEAERCLSCGGCSECLECEKACKADAILHEQREEYIDLNVSSILVATGFSLFDPSEIKEYGYGRYPNVLTAIELERLVCASGPTGGVLKRPSDGKIAHNIAFIQCVGSRTQTKGHPYCSTFCCMYATKEAVLIKEHESSSQVTIFYMDLKTFGKGFQDFVDRAQNHWGVKYIRGRPSEIREDPVTKNLTILYEDTEIGKVGHTEAEMVVLCTASEPHPDNRKLAQTLDVKLDEYGFFEVVDPVTAPIETEKPGVYVCGCCHGPRDIPESVTEASATVAKAAEDMARASLEVKA